MRMMENKYFKSSEFSSGTLSKMSYFLSNFERTLCILNSIGAETNSVFKVLSELSKANTETFLNEDGSCKSISTYVKSLLGRFDSAKDVKIQKISFGGLLELPEKSKFPVWYGPSSLYGTDFTYSDEIDPQGRWVVASYEGVEFEPYENENLEKSHLLPLVYIDYRDILLDKTKFYNTMLSDSSEKVAWSVSDNMYV